MNTFSRFFVLSLCLGLSVSALRAEPQTPQDILAKGRSSRFASNPSDSHAQIGLAFATARLCLTSPLRITSRLIMQKARRQAWRIAPL